jgi:hypothetical protein
MIRCEERENTFVGSLKGHALCTRVPCRSFWAWSCSFFGLVIVSLLAANFLLCIAGLRD